MFSHFFNTARRHFRKDWLYTLINVVGLTLGLALVFFIILYVNKEYSWNNTHQNRNSSYRILIENKNWTEPLSAYPLGPVMLDELPEVDAFSRIGGSRTSVVIDDTRQMSVRAYGVDQGIFDIFTFNILQGNPEQLLKSRENVAISRKIAEAVYLNDNPIGKEFRLAIKVRSAKSI